MERTLIYGSVSIETASGIAQGGILSPFLFNIYLENALLQAPNLKGLSKCGLLLAYADDIIILCTDPNVLATVIQEFDQLSTTHNLFLNINKTLILSDHASFKDLTEISFVKK